MRVDMTTPSFTRRPFARASAWCATWSSRPMMAGLPSRAVRR